MDFGMLGAITGLIGAGLSASNQAAQQNIEWANLMFQKQQAAQQQRMAGAERTDAYGNKQYYDPASNTWVLQLTPTQKSITNAGEQEQLKSLTVDAQRQRQLSERLEQRSLGAEQPYNTAVQGYMYDQPHSEAADRSDLETLMLQANQDAAKSSQDSYARQAIRLGRGADIPKLIKATDDKLGQSTSGTMLQALQAAQQLHASQQAQHDQLYLPEIQNWAKIIDDGGGGAAQRFSDTPQRLDAIQGQQQQGMLGAINNASTNIGSAYKALGDAAGAASPFAALGKSLSGIGEGKGKKKNADGTDAPNSGWFTNTADNSTPSEGGASGGNGNDIWSNGTTPMNMFNWGQFGNELGGPGGFDMSDLGLGDYFG